MSDALRQAIAGEIAAWDGHPSDWEDFLDPAERALALVLADPTVARWKNIADAVDNEPADIDSPEAPVWYSGEMASAYDSGWQRGFTDAHPHLRAAGKTT